jgi:hypothetical protein
MIKGELNTAKLGLRSLSIVTFLETAQEQSWCWVEVKADQFIAESTFSARPA